MSPSTLCAFLLYGIIFFLDDHKLFLKTKKKETYLMNNFGYLWNCVCKFKGQLIQAILHFNHNVRVLGWVLLFYSNSLQIIQMLNLHLQNFGHH